MTAPACGFDIQSDAHADALARLWDDLKEAVDAFKKDTSASDRFCAEALESFAEGLR